MAAPGCTGRSTSGTRSHFHNTPQDRAAARASGPMRGPSTSERSSAAARDHLHDHALGDLAIADSPVAVDDEFVQSIGRRRAQPPVQSGEDVVQAGVGGQFEGREELTEHRAQTGALAVLQRVAAPVDERGTVVRQRFQRQDETVAGDVPQRHARRGVSHIRSGRVRRLTQRPRRRTERDLRSCRVDDVPEREQARRTHSVVRLGLLGDACRQEGLHLLDGWDPRWRLGRRLDVERQEEHLQHTETPRDRSDGRCADSGIHESAVFHHTHHFRTRRTVCGDPDQRVCQVGRGKQVVVTADTDNAPNRADPSCPPPVHVLCTTLSTGWEQTHTRSAHSCRRRHATKKRGSQRRQ